MTVQLLRSVPEAMRPELERFAYNEGFAYELIVEHVQEERRPEKLGMHESLQACLDAARKNSAAEKAPCSYRIRKRRYRPVATSLYSELLLDDNLEAREIALSPHEGSQRKR